MFPLSPSPWPPPRGASDPLFRIAGDLAQAGVHGDRRDLVLGASGLGKPSSSGLAQPCAEHGRRLAMSHCSRNQFPKPAAVKGLLNSVTRNVICLAALSAMIASRSACTGMASSAP